MAEHTEWPEIVGGGGFQAVLESASKRLGQVASPSAPIATSLSVHLSLDMAPHAHAVNVFEDLSGAASGTFDNPYDALIVASHEDPVISLTLEKTLLLHSSLKWRRKTSKLATSSIVQLETANRN